VSLMVKLNDVRFPWQETPIRPEGSATAVNQRRARETRAKLLSGAGGSDGKRIMI
jgi:hypothetical protein